jgi:hypothetical protein
MKLPDDAVQIKGVPHYWISKDGTVYSNYPHKSWGKDIRIISPSWSPKGDSGYWIITLTVDGKRVYKKIHRLVAEAFIPNPYNKPWVLHKDDNSINNKIDNLYWGTASDNIRDSYRVGKRDRMVGEKSNRHVLKEKDIPVIVFMRDRGDKFRDIANAFKVSYDTVLNICNGKYWKHITSRLEDK